MITCPNRGRTLLRLGRREEAREALAEARALAEDLGPEPTADVDALLEGAPTP